MFHFGKKIKNVLLLRGSAWTSVGIQRVLNTEVVMVTVPTTESILVGIFCFRCCSM